MPSWKDVYERDFAAQTASGPVVFTDEQRAKNRQLCDLAADILPIDDDQKTSDCDLLYRFLIGKHWDVPTASRCLRQYVELRQAERLNGIMAEEIAEPFRVVLSPVHGVTTDGLPTLWMTPDPKRLLPVLKAFPKEDLLRVQMHVMETARFISRSMGVDRCNYVLDLGKITVGSVNSMTLGFLRELVKMLQAYYPEIMRRMLIFNTGWVIMGAWKVLKPFIDPRVQDKIRFSNGPPNVKVLAEFMMADDVLPEYGGTPGAVNVLQRPIEEEIARLRAARAKVPEAPVPPPAAAVPVPAAVPAVSVSVPVAAPLVMTPGRPSPAAAARESPQGLCLQAEELPLDSSPADGEEKGSPELFSLHNSFTSPTTRTHTAVGSPALYSMRSNTAAATPYVGRSYTGFSTGAHTPSNFDNYYASTGNPADDGKERLIVATHSVVAELEGFYGVGDNYLGADDSDNDDEDSGSRASGFDDMDDANASSTGSHPNTNTDDNISVGKHNNHMLSLSGSYHSHTSCGVGGGGAPIRSPPLTAAAARPAVVHADPQPLPHSQPQPPSQPPPRAVSPPSSSVAVPPWTISPARAPPPPPPSHTSNINTNPTGGVLSVSLSLQLAADGSTTGYCGPLRIGLCRGGTIYGNPLRFGRDTTLSAEAAASCPVAYGDNDDQAGTAPPLPSVGPCSFSPTGRQPRGGPAFPSFTPTNTTAPAECSRSGSLQESLDDEAFLRGGGAGSAVVGRLLRESGHPIHSYLIACDGAHTARFVLRRSRLRTRVGVYQVVGDAAVRSDSRGRHTISGQKVKVGAAVAPAAEGAARRDPGAWVLLGEDPTRPQRRVASFWPFGRLGRSSDRNTAAGGGGAGNINASNIIISDDDDGGGPLSGSGRPAPTGSPATTKPRGSSNDAVLAECTGQTVCFYGVLARSPPFDLFTLAMAINNLWSEVDSSVTTGSGSAGSHSAGNATTTTTTGSGGGQPPGRPVSPGTAAAAAPAANGDDAAGGASGRSRPPFSTNESSGRPNAEGKSPVGSGGGGGSDKAAGNLFGDFVREVGQRFAKPTLAPSANSSPKGAH